MQDQKTHSHVELWVAIIGFFITAFTLIICNAVNVKELETRINRLEEGRIMYIYDRTTGRFYVEDWHCDCCVHKLLNDNKESDE